MRRASILAALAVTVVVASCGHSSEQPGGCVRTPTTTESGLSYQDLRCGTGAEAAGGSSVAIRYRATLENGAQVDSSKRRGGSFIFRLGRGQGISGLDEGVRGMKVGGRRRLVIPPDLAYGDAGFPPDVGPAESVIFHVTLVRVTD
jgi:FKBP-type peptidyl-prolyl cis-trans isomerase